jgi:hypothetical protein
MTPWDRRNVATPRDTLQPDLLAGYRYIFDLLRVEVAKICNRADVDMSVHREAFELFTDACDSIFDIDFRGTP